MAQPTFVPLPTNVSFGTVTGRFLTAVADSPTDSDRDPEGVAATDLSIRFTPSITPAVVRDQTSTPPVIFALAPVDATVGATGDLLGPDGQAGVRLVASGDPDLDPTGWAWTVTLKSPTFPAVSFSFVLNPGQAVDLATVVQVPAGPGATLDAWLQAVRDARAARDEAVAAAAGGGGGAKPATYLDPRALTDGPLPGGFGNSPFTVNGGALEHTPVVTSNGAAYYQRTLPAPVARIGTVADWDANANGSVALVLPAAPWSNSTLGNAGVHATINADGFVTVGRFEAGTGVVAAHTGQAGDLTGGRHLIEVTLDPRRSVVTVLVDGIVVVAYTDAIAFGMIGALAVWELYELHGSSDVPARLLSLWADVEARIPTAGPLPAIEAGGAGGGSAATAKVVNPDALITTLVTGYPGVQIGGGALALTVKFPPSGKLLVTLGINFTLTGGPDNVLVNATKDGNPGYAVNVAQTDGAAYRTITTLIIGTPGETSVIDWNAFRTGNAFAAFYIGSSYGVAIVATVPAD